MARKTRTDARGERLRPLLPPQTQRTGRPSHDHRTLVEGIVWVVRTGSPWRDVPERDFGPWETCASRYYGWVKAGVWAQVLAELPRQGEAAGDLDWSLQHVDGTGRRAHQHAAGAQKGGTAALLNPPLEAGRRPPHPREHPDEALGRSQGGFSTKLHLRVDRHGTSVTFVITAGQRHEQSQFRARMERGTVQRPGRGRPRIRRGRVVGDKGYSGGPIRRYLRRRGIGVVLPTKTNERPHPRFARAAYRARTVVERTITRLKQCRRIATRYETRAIYYWGLLTLGAILLWV